MSIYKANDIRGIYGTELSDSDAYKLGNAFVRFTKAERIVVGRDNRLSSPSLHEALIDGIQDVGADVLDIGLIDSPGFYFATVYLEHPGLMITASHNPAEYNGFYLAHAHARPINETNGLKQIEKLANTFKKTDHRGTLFTVPIQRPYLKHVLSFIQRTHLKPLKIVIDAGNGMGAGIATQVMGKLPFQIIPLYFESDGHYSHRNPDTANPKNLAHLVHKVKETRADLGVAFDGDADRAGFVDEKGEIIEGSITGVLFAQYLLARHPKQTIVYSSTCSKILPETIKKAGGKPIMEKVGHSYIKTRMHELNALLGIENTGHYMFQKNFYVDSGILAALTMCQLLSASTQPLSQLTKPYKKYYRSNELNFPTRNPQRVLQRSLAEVKKLKPRSINLYDGVTSEFKDYWISIRSSKTEPFVRLVIEGKNKELVDRAIKQFSEMIKKNLN